MKPDHKTFSAFHDPLERFRPRDAKLEGGFIYMPEPLSAEEQDLESKRVRDLEQERNEAWQARKRNREAGESKPADSQRLEGGRKHLV